MPSSFRLQATPLVIDKSAIIATLLKRVAKLEYGHHLDVRSYKRDRGFYLVRLGADSFRVIEAGFAEQDFTTDLAGLRKGLKVIVKREFPRSHKIRVYDLGEFDELAPTITRKKI